MRPLLLALLLAIFATAPATDAPRGTVVSRVDVPRREWPEYPVMGPNSIEQRLQCIRAEIEALGDHEWAGRYGDGPIGIELAPESGAVVSFYGCAEPIIRVPAEVVRTSRDRVELRLLGPGIMPRTEEWEHIVIMRWGSHRFAFPSPWVPEAARDITDGFLRAFGEPDRGFVRCLYPRLAGCRDQPLSGEPQLPADEQWRITGGHLEARVLQLLGCEMGQGTGGALVLASIDLCIDLGELDGVALETTFRLPGFEDAIARITRLDDDWCFVNLSCLLNGDAARMPCLDVGSTLVSVQRLDCPPEAAAIPCFE